MGRPRTWTDKQLADALPLAKSWSHLARTLGLNAYGKTLMRLRGHAARLGLDAGHLGASYATPVYSPEPVPVILLDSRSLGEAVEGARSWAEVQRRLGLAITTANQRKVKEAAELAGLDTGTIAGQAWASVPVAAAPVPFGAQLNARNLSRTGAVTAANWFLSRGYMASLPIEPTTYDLVVESDVGLQRVQIKTTRSNVVGLKRTTYGKNATPSMGRYVRTRYGDDELDFFFVYTAVGEMYLIPYEAVAGLASIVLSRYAKYRVDGVQALVAQSGKRR